MPARRKASPNDTTAHLGFEAKLWLAADKLRNNMDAARRSMNIEDHVIALAAVAHAAVWSAGKDVSAQTRKAQLTCKRWQEAAKQQFGGRFQDEYSINRTEKGPSQKIDLVDVEERVAYELKSSPNNVHMEIYRDVFKILVFNERNPTAPLKSLVFIAPEEGIRKLGADFPKDVQAISTRIGLELKLRKLP